MFDTILKYCFFCCVAALIFLAGFSAKYFDTSFTQPVDNALYAYVAWKEQLNKPVTTESDINDLDSLLAKRHITWDKSLSSDGYTLITMRYSTTAYLLNMQGDVVYRWSAPFRKIWSQTPHIRQPISDKWVYFEKAHVYPNGDLLVIYTGWGDTPYGYGMAKINKNSELIWKYDENVHHDFHVDPQTGNITTLIQKVITSRDKLYNSSSNRMTLDYVVVLSDQGKELERVSIANAIEQSPYNLLLNHYQKNVAAWDRFHTNSIDVLDAKIADKFPLFSSGNILLSIRNLNAIAVLDLQKRQIIWASNGLWKAQHSAHFLDNGNILLFDNKGHAIGKNIYSRIIEINPSNLAVHWSYAGNNEQPFYTTFYGRVQRLENGNLLVLESLSSRIFEITQDKKKAWEYKIPQIILNEAKETLFSPKAVACIPPYLEETHMFDPSISGIIVSALRYPKDRLLFLR